MLLGQRSIGYGCTFEYRVKYEDFLDEGAYLATVNSVTVPSGTVSTIGTGNQAPSLWPDKKSFTFFVLAGSVSENFTITINVTDSLGNVVIDTIAIAVVPV